jgi:8-oxo-dGTP pyrophosphatase MutT (NUDIX family)
VVQHREPEPRVPPERLTVAGLREHWKAGLTWNPDPLKERLLDTARAPTPAAVLVAVVSLPGEALSVLLTQRTAHLSSHPGQVAFPGGKVDADDAGPIAAALREAQEEVGLPASSVEVLGCLPRYITGTGYHVTPVVGLVHSVSDLVPNPHEVADVFRVPLAHLMDPQQHALHRWTQGAQVREWYAMPYQDGGQERYIWGATAGMLRNLYRFLSA